MQHGLIAVKWDLATSKVAAKMHKQDVGALSVLRNKAVNRDQPGHLLSQTGKDR